MAHMSKQIWFSGAGLAHGMRALRPLSIRRPNQKTGVPASSLIDSGRFGKKTFSWGGRKLERLADSLEVVASLVTRSETAAGRPQKKLEIQPKSRERRNFWVLLFLYIYGVVGLLQCRGIFKLHQD